MELELFEKTEIWVRPVRIRDVNLNVVAERVAEVLNLKKEEVMVIDVREDVIALDIMKKTVNAEDIIGKRKPFFRPWRRSRVSISHPIRPFMLRGFSG